MSILHWFGEQSEAVKLAIIGLVGGFGAGFWAAVKEWQKPILNAPIVPAAVTTATAPKAADDPALLILAEVSAMNVNLAQLLSRTVEQDAAQDERIADVIEAITKLTNELYLLRGMIGNNRNPGV